MNLFLHLLLYILIFISGVIVGFIIVIPDIEDTNMRGGSFEDCSKEGE